MIRTILALSVGAVLLAACATDSTDVVRRDDAYVPIGSNIPRKDRKPEDADASRPVMAPGAYIPGPGAPRQ